MDTPLLALTRRRVGPPPDTLSDNLRQLIQLRWLAVGGQLLTIALVSLALKVPLPLEPMLGLVALLATINLVTAYLLPRHRVTKGEILLALLLDMAALTAQLYLSGGASNPFISLYLLQLILGAILLEIPWVWLLLAVASLCYAGLTIRSLPLAYPPGLLPDIADLHSFGTWVSFVMTGSLLGLFVTRITRNLRARDHYVADLRQHAAEEDGIVRMGLFASGAAHELGTPLGSLAVILNDWRRLPQLIENPELEEELDEMQAEVQRCKDIVTGILHSAGKPRAATAGVPARLFLDEVVSAWRPTHPHVQFRYDRDGLDERILPGDPALRQAIWNLLDNAAEFSPGGIELEVHCDAASLSIAVSDRGRGFSEAELASVGKLQQSRKGAGHGLGLFLVANVARRLGGRIAAANRPDGGARVELVLPMMDVRTVS